MTSLEHESNDTSASASDYGAGDWDNENWGDMDTSQDPSSPLAGQSPIGGMPLATNAALTIGVGVGGAIGGGGTIGGAIGGGAIDGSVSHSEVRDGWDNEEWGSLEEEPVS